MFKIRQFVVGAVVHGVGVFLFRHLETFPRGANVTIEVLHRLFATIKAKKGRLPKKLYVQLDNCWRENKNKYVFAFLSDLVVKVNYLFVDMYNQPPPPFI